MATKKKVAVPGKRFVVTLRGYGNPDHAQYVDVAPTGQIGVSSLKEAAEVCQKFIRDWDLGGGNWGRESGLVRESGQPVARVSYNGRLWLHDDAPAEARAKFELAPASVVGFEILGEAL